MTDTDIRWQQRLSNYTRALQQLSSAVSLAKTRSLSDLEKQGLIQAFEFTHELAWNVMRDYFFFQGNSAIMGSRDATRESFNKGLIDKGDVWMEMIKSRNQTSHTYNQAVADEIVNKTIELYHPSFQTFLKTMQALKTNE
jgi:nucleotidyltransferase substrate binding protein (TIGR01987 family)